MATIVQLLLLLLLQSRLVLHLCQQSGLEVDRLVLPLARNLGRSVCLQWPIADEGQPQNVLAVTPGLLGGQPAASAVVHGPTLNQGHLVEGQGHILAQDHDQRGT